MPLTQSCSQVQSRSDQNTLSYANYSVFNLSCVSVGAKSALCILCCQKINSLIILMPFCFVEPFETSAPFTASRSKHSNRSLITNSYIAVPTRSLRAVRKFPLAVRTFTSSVSNFSEAVQPFNISVSNCKLTRSLDQVVYSAITTKHAVESENRT